MEERSCEDCLYPEDVRDAMVECFATAMGGDRQMARNSLERPFSSHGVDWDRPDEEGILPETGPYPKDMVRRLRTRANTRPTRIRGRRVRGNSGTTR